jgi:hypothetical protein
MSSGRRDPSRWAGVWLVLAAQLFIAAVVCVVVGHSSLASALYLATAAALVLATAIGCALLVTAIRLRALRAQRDPAFRQGADLTAQAQRSTPLEASLHLGLRLLPARARARYREEWDAERAELPSSWARVRFTTSLLVLAIPRLAWTLRVGSRRREPQ